MRKKLISMVTVIVLALSLVACGGNANSTVGEGDAAAAVEGDNTKETTGEDTSSDNGNITIGLSLKTVQEEFWQKNLEAFESLAKERGVTLISQIANNESSTQISQIENMATQDLDVLIVVAVDGGTLSSALEKVHAQGIPILLYDQEVTNTYADAFVGYDTPTIGNDIIAGLVADNVEGNFVFLHGDASSGENVTRMIEGEKESIQDKLDSGAVKVVAEQWCTGWTAEQAQAHMENALTENKNDIQAVVCMNDGIASGAIKALETAGVDPSTVPVTGMDGDKTALQRIAQGSQFSTLFKPAKEMAALGIDTAISLVKGEELDTGLTKNYGVNDMVWVEARGVTVTADNLDAVVIDEGYYTHEEIYGN